MLGLPCRSQLLKTLSVSVRKMGLGKGEYSYLYCWISCAELQGACEVRMVSSCIYICSEYALYYVSDKRIQLFMKSLLALPSFQKCMPAVPGGLSVIQTEMEFVGSQYASIVNFNKQVYGPFYANILRKLLFPEAPIGKTETEAPTN